MKRLLCLALAVFLTASPAIAADVLLSQNQLPVRWKDMGDGTYAQVFAAATTTGSSPNPTGTTSAQLAGGAIPLPNAGGVQFQIAGLNADSIAVTQSLDCTNYVTATVLKHDLTTTAATALTGTAANGIYSVMVFGGCLKITRTGTADTLTVTYRGTN